MSRIYLENIHATHIFEWMYNRVMEDGGDGCAFLICENYKEAAAWFQEWMISSNKPSANFWSVHENENQITIISSQEYFLFTKYFLPSSTPNYDHFGDYVFVIQKDCQYKWGGENVKNRVLKPINI